MVGEELLDRARLDAIDGGTEALVGLLDEVLQEQHDVAPPFSKRRHKNLEHVQAIVEVLAKLTFFDACGEVADRRGDNAHIDFDVARSANGAHRALLEHAKELDLQRQRQLA